MSKINLNEDDGYCDVEIDGGSVKLDICKANNVYAELSQRHTDAVQLADAWIEWLQTQSMPIMSHSAAFKLAGHVQEEAARLKKEWPGSTSENADSPGSTGSTVSGSSPGPSAT